MQKLASVSALAALNIVLAACSSGRGATDKTDQSLESGEEVVTSSTGEVSVVTWWEAGSEKKDLDALVKVFETEQPECKLVNAAVAGGGGSQAKQKLAADLAAQNPPDTFQAHAGAELTDYIDAMQIEDVSALYDEYNLR